MTIGEFAQLTHLGVRTLRRYHESGLLEPASVDPASGYRYHTAGQIPAAQVIHRLRELDVPLADVAKILATEDAAERADLVAGHLRRLEEELERTRAAVVSLQRLLSPASPGDDGPDVELRSVAARTVAAVEDVVDQEDVLSWFDRAMAELDAAIAGLPPLGPPGGRYANELFTGGRGAVLVHRPVADPPARGRVRPVELPPAELAVVVHHGPHDDIDVTYGRLGAWVVEHALTVAGPVHETYAVGPRDNPAPATWRTEIGWPVFRLASSP
ncbi:MerR family transcriptional regulator [Amycolatopsis sp. NPDC024027]|uniref:MerR family transcriptional regulator n=1 Tax=Amycolatopsis sp. NPDC024027 TaxID=3154327 RepID=UPI0033F4B0FC